MIPVTLDGWTYSVVFDLCRTGRGEHDLYDFKFDVRALHDPSKICCAFANSQGGFIVVGVKEDTSHSRFQISGIDPDTELFSKFLNRVKIEPSVEIPEPKIIEIPNEQKVLYIIHVPKSWRQPHLPTEPAKRYFWKRQGSDCVQMTLEEIRSQMLSFEEKRDKLSLLLLELGYICRTLENQVNQPGAATGEMFSFGIIDRVVVEAYTFLKQDINTIGALDVVKRRLMSLNSSQQTMITTSVSEGSARREQTRAAYRELLERTAYEVYGYREQIVRSFREKFDIINPYGI